MTDSQASATAIQRSSTTRSPTLLRGETPGAQGPIIVWSPRRRVLWRGLLGCILCYLGCYFALAAWLLGAHVSVIWRLLVYMLALGPIAGAVRTSFKGIRRPLYLSADDSGFAIAGFSGSVALRWKELDSIARGRMGMLTVRLKERRVVTIFLTGYTRSDRSAIFETTVKRGKLRRVDEF